MALAAASAVEHDHGHHKMEHMKHEDMDSHKNMFYYMPHNNMDSYKNQRHFPAYVSW